MKSLTRRSRLASRAGFTLLEVMIGLGILGFSLMVLIRSASSSMLTAARAQMLGVVTDLSRGKMLDIEETLLKDGFTDTDQSEENKTFEEEGWKNIKYSYKVEQVELPSWDTLQGLTQDRNAGSGSGSGSAGATGANAFQDSALGGMLGQLGGGLGGGGAASGNLDAMQGASFIQGQYTMVQEILKVSIRKITLTVTYKVGTGGDDENLVTVLFITDSAAMDKVLMGVGAQELPPEGSGSGSGSGSSGSGRGGSTTGTRPTRPGGGSGK